ncbi:hydroxyacid-oxoacid transhydrogenase [Dermacoccus abyssi]|uniref:hydroxyacid-oxoacid transhydrogenase n=1 Tax=Dermacoccus abyssi TaxID=322596 RepID=UPI002AD2A2E1|nr:hydroxyacid-oxoacid transhydrogenase [Dermacoccus abyssi]
MSETIFTYGSPQLKYGTGAVTELGHDATTLGARTAAVVSDPGVAAAGIVTPVVEALEGAGVRVDVFTDSHVEPTDASLEEAAAWAREHGPWDVIVAVGGGSSIDTAKAINLMTTNDGELMDYVNAPVGGGANPTRPLVPLIAVPTTAGTGSESTTICVLDVLEQNVKTGISHPALRPRMAVIDPDLTISQPAGVTAASGMDILCHALESYTAKPYTEFARKKADERVPYCGANPISDMWSREAVRLLAGSFRTAVNDGANTEARGAMALAATFAGMGFGNAGVHLPHANAYPIAGMVREFRPDGYDADHAMVPHGMAVALTAPAAFALLYPANPERHHEMAALLEPDTSTRDLGRDALPDALRRLMRDIGFPNGLTAVGYSENDVAKLAEGTMKQQRLLATAPVEITEADVERVLRESMTLW